MSCKIDHGPQFRKGSVFIISLWRELMTDARKAFSEEDFDRVEKLLIEALDEAKLERHRGPFVEVTQLSLANFFRDTGRNEEAKQIYNNILPVFEDLYGVDHALVAEIGNSLEVIDDYYSQSTLSNGKRASWEERLVELWSIVVYGKIRRRFDSFLFHLQT